MAQIVAAQKEVTQFPIIGLAGVALAGVLAHVAITGRVPVVSRIVVGLAAATTLNQALENLGAVEF